MREGMDGRRLNSCGVNPCPPNGRMYVCMHGPTPGEVWRALVITVVDGQILGRLELTADRGKIPGG